MSWLVPHLEVRCHAWAMPARRRLQVVTETEEVAQALDDAAECRPADQAPAPLAPARGGAIERRPSVAMGRTPEAAPWGWPAWPRSMPAP